MVTRRFSLLAESKSATQALREVSHRITGGPFIHLAMTVRRHDLRSRVHVSGRVSVPFQMHTQQLDS